MVSCRPPTVLVLLDQFLGDGLVGGGGLEGLLLCAALQAHRHALDHLVGDDVFAALAGELLHTQHE